MVLTLLKERSTLEELGEISRGYLSFSTDLTSTIYGGFGSLPCNLLKFFLPVFKEVALLNGMQMAKNPPRPAVIPLGRKGMENDGIGK